MQSTNLVVSKSQNQIAVYGLPFSPLSYSIALTANTDAKVQVPLEMDVAVMSYSSGATVIVLEGVTGATNSAPSGTFSQTTQRINPPVCAVSPKDGSGNSLYLHLLSPNPNDWVIVSFYRDGDFT